MISIEQELQRYGARPGEWPALFVLDALHSARLRLVLAAEAAVHETTPDASQYFLTLADKPETRELFLVDDETFCPAAVEDRSFRRFLRFWLKGTTWRFARWDTNLDKQNADRGALVSAICYLRHPSAFGQHQHAISDIDPMLGLLDDGIRTVAASLETQSPAFDLLADAFSESDASPLLRFSLGKHAADAALYHGFNRMAIQLYEQGRESLNELDDVPDSLAMEAVLDSCIAFAKAGTLGASEAVAHLEPVRSRVRGDKVAGLVDDALFFHRYQQGLIEGRNIVGDSAHLEQVFDPFLPGQALRAYDRAASGMLTRDADDVAMQCDEAESVAFSLGSIHFAKLTQVSRAIGRLIHRPTDADQSLIDLVKSGGAGATIHNIFKRLPDGAVVALSHTTNAGLKQAWRIANHLEGERPHRVTALACLFELMVEAGNMDNDRVSIIAPILMDIAGWSRSGSITANMDALTPSLRALSKLSERHPEWVMRALDEHELATGIERSLKEGSWSAREAAIDVTAHLTPHLSRETTARLLECIAEILETIEPQKTFWPPLPHAFGLIGSPAVVAMLKDDLSLHARVVTQVKRLCYSKVGEDGLSLAQRNAFWLTRSLGFDPPKELRDLIAAHLDVVRGASNSSAPESGRSLISILDWLVPDEVLELIRALSHLVHKRRLALDRTAVSSSTTAGAVFELSRKLADGSELDRPEVREAAEELFDRGRLFIENSISHPVLMCRVVFLSSDDVEPQPVIAFNWGYAIQGLGAALGRSSEAMSLVEQIRDNPSVDRAIRRGLARAFSEFAAFGDTIFDTLSKPKAPSLDEAHRTPDEWYHELLPGWLSRLSRIDPMPEDFLEHLVDRCIDLGPHPTDISVFTLAARRGSVSPALDDIPRLQQYHERLFRQELEWSVKTLIRNLLSTMRPAPQE